jgi:hypothetical protein
MTSTDQNILADISHLVATLCCIGPPRQARRNLWVVLPITISISYAPGGPFVSDKMT